MALYKKLFLLMLAGLSYSSAILAKNSQTNNQKPTNVVLILIDDLSHYGVSAYGANRLHANYNNFPDVEFSTPNIDELANGGFMAANAFSYPLCENTRVALMSGKENNRNYLRPKSLHSSDITFGDTFKKAGYKTGLFGKWKQTRGTTSIAAEEYLYEFGWDEHTAFDVTTEMQRFINPLLVVNGEINNYMGRTDLDPATGRRWYGPDIVNRDALSFIEKNQEQPFFLYYPMMLVHDEHQPTPDTIPKSAFDNFLERKVKGVKNSGDDLKYFPDMIAYTDKLIGKVVKKIDQLGLRENTLIIVVGDNGTKETFAHILPDNSIYPARKGGHADNGIHVPLILNQPNTIPASYTKNVYQGLIDITDIYPTMAEAANIAIPNKANIDGISFWQQAKGKKSESREVIFHTGIDNFKYTDKNGLITYAFNKNFKRYSPSYHFPKGRFFDLRTDPLERIGSDVKSFRWGKLRYSGLALNKLTKEQQQAYDTLGKVLEKNKIVNAEKLTIQAPRTTLRTNEKVTLTSQLMPANTTRNSVIWHSSNPDIISINKFGEIIAHKRGKATISVYSWSDAEPLANGKNPEFLTTGVQDSILITVN